MHGRKCDLAESNRARHSLLLHVTDNIRVFLLGFFFVGLETSTGLTPLSGTSNTPLVCSALLNQAICIVKLSLAFLPVLILH